MDYKSLVKVKDNWVDAKPSAFDWAKLWLIDLRREGIELTDQEVVDRLMDMTHSASDEECNALAYAIMKLYNK